jgi:hypothetical protein
MTLPNSYRDREQQKFSEGTNGEVLVNVKSFSSGNLLEGVVFDYIAATYPDTVTEVYTYKSGGVGGTTVATLTVIYTDDTKEILSSVARS